MANDPTLLAKMADKLKRGKRGVQSVREGISKRADRLGVSHEAAQVLWAKELGISTGRVTAHLPPEIQRQVQEHRSRVPAALRRAAAPARTRDGGRQSGDPLRAAVGQLITDPELVEVSADILRLTRRFDRAINHATQVLENRLRAIAGTAAAPHAKAHDVAAIALLSSRGPMLRVDPDNVVQDGYYHVCNGLFASFRNPTHHGGKHFSRQDAISACGFINVLLDALAKGTRAPAPAAPTPKSSLTMVPPQKKP